MKMRRITETLAVLTALSLPLLLLPYAFASASQRGEKDENEGEPIISVFNTSVSQKTEMPLLDYVCGAVAAEMPALYHDEALKAQAAAVFTYLARRGENGASDTHEGCAVCTSSSHCCAFIDETAQHERWGEDYDKYRGKIEEAVKSVYGKIISFVGEPIDALYFARSAGRTENASDVWGGSMPYLTAVDSSVDLSEGGAVKTVEYSFDDFRSRFSSVYPSSELSKPSVTSVTRSESGGVITASVCGEIVTGREMRSIFSLPSANFTVTVSDASVIFTVYGKGHCVGMSQYGANMMAKLGYGWEEIVKHYYTGVEITDYDWQKAARDF